jgi:hypothetical protein
MLTAPAAPAIAQAALDVSCGQATSFGSNVGAIGRSSSVSHVKLA